MKIFSSLLLSFLLFLDLKATEGPDFLIIGTKKGGTTSLHYYLKTHPMISPGKKKEIHFFSKHYDKGIEWYNEMFSHNPSQLHFEASVDYIIAPAVPKRVIEHYPDIKIIALLRDPTSRAYSQYRMWVKYGKEKRSFEEIVEDELKAIKENKKSRKRYLSTGFYLDQIKRWLKYVPKERMLIIRSEDLFKNPKDNVIKVHRFLGIPEMTLDQYPNKNPAQSDGSILSAEMKAKLDEFYKPHNEALAEFLNNEKDRNFNGVWCLSPR